MLSRLLSRGDILRVESTGGTTLGYALPEADTGEETFSSLVAMAVRHPDAVLCLGSGLRYHGLTDRIGVDTVGAVPPGANRVTSLSASRLISWSKPEMFEVGITSVTEMGIPFRITDAARTVLDMFRPRHRQETSEKYIALRELVERDGEAAIAAISEYADRLGCMEHVSPALNATKENLPWRVTR